ncbi:Protein of unknown function D [Prunus dulcis]|uniref:Uncharacterized protein n=1 Tax=Prunus dulcis TaxID=3755 RepID=A0A4Y1QZ06_PRUDU|nr:Protein of unknown function D [Prunus dulcis]
MKVFRTPVVIARRTKMKTISLLHLTDRRFPPTIYSKMARSVLCSRFSTGISCSPTLTTTKLPELERLPLRLPICGCH